MIKIRLSFQTSPSSAKFKPPPTSNKIISISSTCTFDDLKTLAVESFPECGATVQQLVEGEIDVNFTTGGRPPRPIQPPFSGETVITDEGRISAMDSVGVEFVNPKQQQKNKKRKNEPKANPSGPVPTTKRGKKAGISAVAPTKPAAPKKTKEQKAMDKLGGFSLQSGAALPPKRAPAPQRQPKPNTRKQNVTNIALGSSKDDVATTLLTSTSTGGGQVNKFLRKAMRGAVGKSYEATLANCRVAAVLSSKVDSVIFEPNGETKTSDGNQVGYKIRYDKGNEGRGHFEDEVEILDAETLKAVVTRIYEGGDEEGKMMLRPEDMAQLSPRVFWSLVKLYGTELRDVRDMLEVLLPELDFKYLRARVKTLSEKARENKMIEEGLGGEEVGVRVIEDLEERMVSEAEKGGDIKQLRRKVAEAALLRSGNNGNNNSEVVNNGQIGIAKDDWEYSTPTEDDFEEIMECITQATTIESFTEHLKLPSQPTALREKFQKQNIHNLRSLANADPKILTNSLSDGDGNKVEMMAAIVTAAQASAIEEIMFEILDSNEQAYDALISVKSGTVKDLVGWDGVESLLCQEMRNRNESYVFSENVVASWIERAKRCLKKDELWWLGMWVTPV